MPRRIAPALELPIQLDSRATRPLYRQLYDELRTAILSGRLTPGSRLPSTRELARGLGLARLTVLEAFEQLIAEGYLEGRVGSGTYVAASILEGRSQLLVQSGAEPPGETTRRGLSKRGQLLAATPVVAWRAAGAARAFQPGLPDLDQFPFAVWARIAARIEQRPPRELLAYGEPAGYYPLRSAIASYLGQSRAVRCSAEQVIITSGSQQALDLAARVLLDPTDSVWVEDPGYAGTRAALIAAGAQLAPIPVDSEGLQVAYGAVHHADARMVCVAPSHQYPLGVTMSLTRRLALLDWAARAGAWILEDDYDSEFRYDRRPLAALQGLNSNEQVIYTGTFSKVLYPGLRLGYLVAPADLAPAFIAARALLDRQPAGVVQAILSEFMSAGHFARHIRRMRGLYAQRQQALLEAARHELPGGVELQPDPAEMHLLAQLPAGSDDRAIARRAFELNVVAPPLSAYGSPAMQRRGLLLGYAAFERASIDAAMPRLAQAIRDVTDRSGSAPAV